MVIKSNKDYIARMWKLSTFIKSNKIEKGKEVRERNYELDKEKLGL